MSLIERMRASTDSLTTKVLLGLALIAFVGVGGQGASGVSGGVIATVNGQSISTTEWQDALRAASREKSGAMSDADRDALAATVRDQLITQEVMRQEAEKLGFAVDDTEVKRYIVGIDAFQVEGKFDEKTYKSVLERMGKSRTEFEINVRKMLLLQKLEDFAGRAVVIDENRAKEEWVKENTQMQATFVRLVPDAFVADVVVSDSERDTFASANAAKIKERYDEDFNRLYNLPKRLHLAKILLKADAEGVDRGAVAARAEALRKEIEAGRDFAEAARSESADPSAADGGDIGLVAETALDPAFAQAIAASPTSLPAVVESPVGFTILKVSSVSEAKTTSLEAATPEIATRLLQETKVNEVMQAFGSTLIAAWPAGGLPPDDLLAGHSLKIDITDDFSLAETVIPKLEGNEALLAALLAAKQGEVLPVPFTIKDNVFVVQLSTRVDADPAAFATDGQGVRARMAFTEKLGFLEAWRKDLVARADVEKANTQ